MCCLYRLAPSPLSRKRAIEKQPHLLLETKALYGERIPGNVPNTTALLKGASARPSVGPADSAIATAVELVFLQRSIFVGI